MKSFLVLHITGGSLAVLAGYAAIFAPKGGWLHRRAGKIFVYAMIAMGIGAMIIGIARGRETWIGGPMVIYFVVTSMLTVQRTQPSLQTSIALMILGFVAGIVSIAIGIMLLSRPPGPIGYAPAIMSLVNATLLLLGAAGDFRVLRSGPPTGTRRLRRHLWRMCYAMFVATGSFFLGQAQVIPKPLRIGPMLQILAFLPLLVLFYWMWRVRTRSRRVVTRVPQETAA